MSQTAYNKDMDVAFAGMKADSRFDEVESFAADGAIPFGRGLSAPAGETVKVNIAKTGEVFRGISLHTALVADSSGVVQYKDKDAVNVLRKGVVWVDTDVAVTADDPVYVLISGGTGKFTNVATGNITTGGKFRSTISAAGLAKVEIDL